MDAVAPTANVRDAEKFFEPNGRATDISGADQDSPWWHVFKEWAILFPITYEAKVGRSSG